jgi:hypothetical protein
MRKKSLNMLSASSLRLQALYMHDFVHHADLMEPSHKKVIQSITNESSPVIITMSTSLAAIVLICIATCIGLIAVLASRRKPVEGTCAGTMIRDLIKKHSSYGGYIGSI